MANEKFKVKFGLAVGDTAATVDGTTGDIATAGDIAVNGGDITTSSAAGAVFNTGATTLNIGGAATTVSIGANSGTTTVNNSLVADDLSTTTVDTTNLEVTNIKAKDGTAAIVIADSTGVVTVSTETDTNISDGNYILGAISATRNTAFVPPTSGLSTVSGNNGVSAASSTNFGAQFQAVYFSGDTTAGTASSAGLSGRGASGTNSAPGPAASQQVLLTLNGDGHATTGFANNIATVNSGGGTASILPAQIQLYARQAFADDGTTVTAAGTGFRVRGFQNTTSMSVANRQNFIDHHLTTATYKASTFNIQSGASTTNHAVFATTGHTIGAVDSPVTVTRAAASAGIKPVQFVRNIVPGTASPVTGDGAAYRLQVVGTSGTVFGLANVSGSYSSTGDTSLTLDVANGDQNTSVMSTLSLLVAKPSSTTIKGVVSPTASAGGNTAVDVAVFAPATTRISSDAITLEDNSGTDYLVLNSTSATFSQPVGLRVYTAATKPATGVVGQIIAISDSAGGGNPNGMIAFFDTTNSRWSYIHDNSAV